MIRLRGLWEVSMTANIWHNWWLENSWYFQPTGRKAWWWNCHLACLCSLLCDIVLLMWWRLWISGVSAAAASRVNVYSLHKNKKEREGIKCYLFFTGPSGESWMLSRDTLSCNSKRVLLVATQGHHPVALRLACVIFFFSFFVVCVVWREKKVHKSYRQVTNRSPALTRSQCVFHISYCEPSFFYVGQYERRAIPQTVTGKHIDNSQDSPRPRCENLGTPN